MEIVIPLAVLAMCLVLTLTARTDTIYTDPITPWVSPGSPELGVCEFDTADPPADESETEPLPAVVDTGGRVS